MVYDLIDYMKLGCQHCRGTTVQLAESRYLQFETVPYNRAVDDELDTTADVDVEPFNVIWSLEQSYSADAMMIEKSSGRLAIKGSSR